MVNRSSSHSSKHKDLVSDFTVSVQRIWKSRNANESYRSEIPVVYIDCLD